MRITCWSAAGRSPWKDPKTASGDVGEPLGDREVPHQVAEDERPVRIGSAGELPQHDIQKNVTRCPTLEGQHLRTDAALRDRPDTAAPYPPPGPAMGAGFDSPRPTNCDTQLAESSETNGLVGAFDGNEIEIDQVRGYSRRPLLDEVDRTYQVGLVFWNEADTGDTTSAREPAHPELTFSVIWRPGAYWQISLYSGSRNTTWSSVTA